VNRYGQQSQLKLEIACSNNQTILQDAYFTAPYKILSPYYAVGNPALMQLTMLSVSAGLMAGDDQQIAIQVLPQAQAQINSQAAEKIHAMPDYGSDSNCATRSTALDIAQNALLIYTPLQVIPFADSTFKSTTNIALADSSSRLFYSDIVAAGRVAYQERFEFREYRNRITVCQADQLIYADNAVFIPQERCLDKLTLFEGYSHTITVLMFNFNLNEQQLQTIKDICAELDGIVGITRTCSQALCIKALANSSDLLLKLRDELLQTVS
jgi:urease accessory protein